jgi:hypothetical protein
VSCCDAWHLGPIGRSKKIHPSTFHPLYIQNNTSEMHQKYIVSHGAQELHVLLLSETAEPMENLMGCASYEYLGIFGQRV